MDIYEWSAIEAYKRGERAPLVERWMQLQGKPSPLLHQFILDLLQGKPLRGRGRPTNATKAAMIKDAYILMTQHDPSAKKTAIHASLKERFNLSTKRIEQILYGPPKSSRRSLK